MDEERIRPTGIGVAPNGARRGKTDHPALPITPGELAREAGACLAAGAGLLHLHVRDRTGAHLLDANAYAEAIAAVRAEVGARMIVQITTEAVGRYSPSQQIEVIKKVRPEAASMALRELVPDDAHEAEFARLSAWMAAANVTPQIIVYSAKEARQLAGLLQRGALAWASPAVLFVLGRYSQGQRSSPSDLIEFIAPECPQFAHWSVCAFGPQEAASVTAGALLGGHVRVGFENNLHLPDGRLAPHNAALVKVVADALATLGRPLATADDMRAAMAANP